MNRTSKGLLVLLMVWGQVALAQEPQPTVAPFPLELRRLPSGFSKKEKEELQAEFRRLVRSAGAMVPNAGTLESALKDLKRQDCDRENECLQQLAQKAQTLYGLFVAVDYDLTKKVTVSGRVVRDDGQLIGELRTVSLPKGGDAFLAVARVALVQLLDALAVKRLSPFREVKTPPVEVKPEPVKTVEPVKTEPVLPPPPVTPPLVAVAPDNSGVRTTGYVLAGVGVAAVVAGAILFGVGRGNTGLDANNVITDRSTFQSSQTFQAAGVGMLAGGAAVAVAGGALVLLNPRQTVAVLPSVGPQSVGVVLGGSF